jgi:neutral ceramidase
MRAGFGRSFITAWEPGRRMLGWADRENVAMTLREPLPVRALALRDEAGSTAVLISAELCFISDALHRAIVERLNTALGLPPAAVMVTATHNHSGPGGFSDAFWFDIASGGPSRRTFDGIAQCIVEAAEQAVAALEPAELSFIRGPTGLNRYATNRAWRAYNRNRDVAPVSAQEAQLAVDDEMQLLRIDSAASRRPLGLVSWLGLHGTCMHGDSAAIQMDHKGRAAELFERQQEPGFTAMFLQGPCGDITPNLTFDARRGRSIGRGKDDLESRERVASMQARAARWLFEQAKGSGITVGGPIRAALRREALASMTVDTRFTSGISARTSPPRVGLGMTLGTDEGRGPAYALAPVLRGVAWATRAAWRVSRRFRADAPLSPLPLMVNEAPLEARVLGLIRADGPFFPADLQHDLGRTLDAIRRNAPPGERWLPDAGNAQVLCVGGLAIAGVAAEPTTVAGRRLRESLRRRRARSR